MFGVVLVKSKVWSLNAKTLHKLIVTNIKLRNASLEAKQIRQLSDRRYSDKHEWITLDSGKTIGTVGVSKYAEEALGDVVYVQLPDVGNTYAQNDEVGAVESVKAASEIYTPVSGRVVEINQQLEEKPGLVNSSCYENGWLFKIELNKIEEYNKLMSEDSYQNFLKSIKEE